MDIIISPENLAVHRVLYKFVIGIKPPNYSDPMNRYLFGANLIIGGPSSCAGSELLTSSLECDVAPGEINNNNRSIKPHIT